MRPLYFFISASFAALVLASCNKDDVTSSAELPADRLVTIVANIESSIDTKTSLLGSDEIGYQVLWSEGDKIYLNDGWNSEFTLVEGAGSTTGKFVGEIPKTDADGEYDVFYAIRGKWLPDTSSYVPGCVIKSAPMAAKATIEQGDVTSITDFKNLCGLLRLTLKGSGTVRQIKLYATQRLYGNITISEGGSVSIGGGSTTGFVSHNCKDGVDITGDGTDFYIPLVQNNYSGVKIEIRDCSGNTCTKTLKSGSTINITRARVTPVSLTVTGLADRPDVPDGALYGVFTVKDPDGVMNSGDERKVYFSKGNLYCEVPASTVEFKFENNQYDFPKEYAFKSVNHVGHFYWCKNASIAYGMEYHNPTGYDARHDVLFTNNPQDAERPNDNFTVNGISGLYRALSQSEWEYLFAHHSHRRVAIEGFTVKDGIELKGCVIAPDNEKLEENKFSYTPEELSEKNLVFLPAAGLRWGYGGVKRGGLDGNYYYEGYYWSSSPDPVGNSVNNEFDTAFYYKLTNDDYALNSVFNCGLWGFCLRLVTDVDYERPLVSSDIERPEDGDDYDWE